MGKYLPRGVKLALYACLGALGTSGAALFADVPTSGRNSDKCCCPNARNFGYWEAQWREWPCDQRPEKVFPTAVGTEVIPAPPGKVPTPLPKANPSPTTKQEGPGAGLEPSTTPEPQPQGTPLPGEGMRLPGEGTHLPGEGMRLPGEGADLPGEGMRLPGNETPAEKPAPKRPAKSTTPTPPAAVVPTPTQPAPKQPATEGGLQGLQPESPLPPATKDGPVAPLPPANKEQAPAPTVPSPVVPSPVTPSSASPTPVAPTPLPPETPASKPDDLNAPKAPMPGDAAVLPSQQSQVVQAEAFAPIEGGRTVMPVRADWVSPQVAEPEPKRVPPPASPVSGVAAEAPVALGGYCPVALTDEEKWVRGDPRWSAVYGGHTFLCSGPEQQQRFLAAAERFLPAFAGDDPVLAVESVAHVAGSPQHSLVCGGKVHLFSSAETLARFQQDPRRYTAATR